MSLTILTLESGFLHSRKRNKKFSSPNAIQLSFKAMNKPTPSYKFNVGYTYRYSVAIGGLLKAGTGYLFPRHVIPITGLDDPARLIANLRVMQTPD